MWSPWGENTKINKVPEKIVHIGVDVDIYLSYL